MTRTSSLRLTPPCPTEPLMNRAMACDLAEDTNCLLGLFRKRRETGQEFSELWPSGQPLALDVIRPKKGQQLGSNSGRGVYVSNDLRRFQSTFNLASYKNS